MKKIILLVFALFMFMLQSNAVEMKFEEAYAQSKSKPAAIFLYADWADNAQECRVQFENIQQQLGNKYNYVFLDLSNKDTKGFNKIFPIYTVPYIFTFRANIMWFKWINFGDTHHCSNEATTNRSTTTNNVTSII